MKNIKSWLISLTSLAVAIAISSCSSPADTSEADANTQAGFDPVSMDPQVTDPEYPPKFAGWSLEIEGSLVNAAWWQPKGKGPNPTILLLHGYPGNEKNLDLARALQRAGFNVAFFHYRGSWGSAGYFSFSNALEDIATVVDELRSCDSNPDCDWPIDPDKIAIFGHSMGGWLGMLSAMEVPEVSCAAILDFGMASWATWAAEDVAEHGEVPSWLIEQEDFWMAEGRPLRIEGKGSFSTDLLANVERFGPIERAAELARQNLFILSTTDNETHPIVVQALEEQGPKRLRSETWESDHSFNDRRIELAYAMVDYYSNSCFN